MTELAAPTSAVIAPYEDALRGRTLVLYDGVCVMCNRTIRVLLANDAAGRLRFTPIEGALGQAMLARHPGLFSEPKRNGKPEAAAAQSVVVIVDALTAQETAFKRSDAAIEAMRRLRAPWPLLAMLLQTVPQVLRDGVYRLVARLRYPLFGRYAACPRPVGAEREHILGA
jgi:predicted DCC family thiol-disulfide oxidoreductase YuxK